MKKILKLSFYFAYFILILLVFTGDFWQELYLKTQNMLFYFKPSTKPSNNCVIIDIDDDTFYSINQKWPFNRDIHANLIKNLQKLQVKQIVFDVEFTEESKNDSALIQATKSANCIFAGKLYYTQNINYSGFRLIKPIAGLIKNNNYGVVNINQDVDGFVRQYKPFYNKVPTLAAKAILNNSIKIENKHYTINYLGKAKTIPTYSYIDFIDSKYKKESDFFDDLVKKPDLKNKTVFIGSSVSELHDLFFTPFGVMPGVEIQANFYEMFITNNFLHNSLKRINFALYLGIFAFCIFIFKIVKPTFSWLLLLSFLPLCFYISSYFLNTYNLILPLLNFLGIILFCWVFSILNHYKKSALQKRFIKNSFEKYMSPRLVKELLKNPKNLNYGGTTKEITVLFADIRNFTSYTENHKPKQTVAILRQYLTAMTKIIIDEGGTIDKFVGDEIVAFFGVPVKLQNHAYSACKAAISMQKKLKELHKEWQQKHISCFDIGIGINTGTATVGNLGSEQIFDYTAIGDTVNLGARLEALNKEYINDSKIIISKSTLKKANKLVQADFINKVAVRGKQKAVEIYTLKSVLLK